VVVSISASYQIVLLESSAAVACLEQDGDAMVTRELISISNSPPPCLRAHSIAGRQH
jgi:hypothetical protein